MTKSSKIFDVVIIGGGPAGASLAYRLAKKGLSPMVVDQHVFPRKKLCAGGLPVKTLELLPPDFHPPADEIIRVVLSHRLQKEFTKSYQQPLIYVVDRQAFDNFLVQKAKQAGAIFYEGEKVDKIAAAPEVHVIYTTRRTIRAKIVVGADGARSVVAAGLGLHPVDSFHLALQVTAPAALLKKQVSTSRDTILLDWGSIPDGYGWVFPRGDSAAIGVAGPLPLGRQIKSFFDKFLSHVCPAWRNARPEAHLIPHRLRENLLCTDKALLVGDAAGLVDFWTGEGIFYALLSAKIAAAQIIRAVGGDPGALRSYQTIIDERLAPELATSYRFSKIFNRLAPLAFLILQHYDYPWDIFCRIMRGDRTFAEMKERFRPDRFLRRLLIKSARGSVCSPAHPEKGLYG